MAVFAFTAATVFAGGYDLSSDLDQIAMNITAAELEVTTFGDTYVDRIGGLKSVAINHNGFNQFANPDSQMFTDLANERVFTVTPDGSDGAVAYFCNARRFEYTPIEGSVGEVLRFSGSAMSSDGVGVVRGELLKPKGSVSGAANGTGQQLGAVSSSQKLYTAIHVFSAGTTAQVIVESDDNSGFTSATTRSTTTVTAAGGTWVSPVSGAITDDWWRVRFASVTGTFSLAVAVGIR